MRTTGRAGDGPGEFRRLSQLFALPSDSILAYDFWQARLTVVASDGELGRTVSIEGAYRPRPLFPVRGGGFVGESTDFTGFGEEAGLQRTPSPIVRIGEDGLTLDTLVTIPGYESVAFSRGDGWVLWGKDSHLAVRGDEVFLGSADQMEYRVHSTDGTLRRIVRVLEYELTLTRAEIEAENAAVMPDPSDASTAVREIMELQPSQRHRPAYSDMVVDALGNVWLERYQGLHEEGERITWQVFGTDGAWLGPVALPPRFDIFRIGSDWILGRQLDEFDVEHVQLLELSRLVNQP